MATISLANSVGAGTHPSRGVRQVPYVVENIVNIASAVTAKGSALAATDVIEALTVPAQTVILSAGIEVFSAVTGDALFSLGVTGVSAGAYVATTQVAAASAVGSYIASAAAGYPIAIGATADTLDLLVGTVTTAISAGKLRVWAVVCDVQDRREIEGLSVDRDQLA